jgi:hypothetical protein
MEVQKHIGYRIAVMLLCLGITAYALSQFAQLIQPFLAIPYDWKVELVIVTGQLIFQFPFIYKKPHSLKIVYYENMLMVSLIGSILLLPLIVTNRFYILSPVVNFSYFALVVGILFLEHYRRVKRLDLPSYLCWTWVLYRLIVLTIIL